MVAGRVTGRNNSGDAERISQIAQWYGDPDRDLPRKVVADVQWLLCHIDTLKQQALAAAEPEAKAITCGSCHEGNALWDEPHAFAPCPNPHCQFPRKR